MDTIEMVITVVGALIAIVGVIAEITDTKTDNKILKTIKTAWKAITLGIRKK